MIKKYQSTEFGYEIEVGSFARQADGAIWLRQGGTVILATVVSQKFDQFPGFLPLTIDYRELFSAAGKIPGGYYKREGKFTDKEVLTARLIDRALRPLFPATFFNQVQMLITVYSVDKAHMPANLALLASSLALGISKIPFLGPVGVVELGLIDGKLVVNPSYDEELRSTSRIVVAGTAEGICMVEGSFAELSEKEFIDALFFAHDIIKKQVAWQEEVIKQAGQQKEVIEDKYSWNVWQERVEKFFTEDRVRSVYVDDKIARAEQIEALRAEFVAPYAQEIEEKKLPELVIEYIFDSVMKDRVTELIFAVQKRIDGRAFDVVRSIDIRTSLLPSTHGSAVFTRGRTQVLASVTLGGGQDEQRIEGLVDGEDNGSFMLHYNFPPFSVGEVRQSRGPGRREIGHGYLAASAVKEVLPSKKDFLYTIRIVADVLESDGSSSMATVCSSIMALMDTGVPIRKPVAGVAMGLLKNKNDIIVLTDICGFEDAYGLMDFKVAGTEQGITAIQMDIKYKGGLGREVFESALEQARKGRLHILGEMKKVLEKPREEMSSMVPKILSFHIAQGKIGMVIGPGGKVIREIIEKTAVASIDIEDDGLVKIFGGPDSRADQAEAWIRTLAGQIERGSRYTGAVRRIAEFGLFVELVPGQDGLVHVSNIPRSQQKTFMQDFPVGSMVTVEVVDYEQETGRIRLKLITDEKEDKRS